MKAGDRVVFRKKYIEQMGVAYRGCNIYDNLMKWFKGRRTVKGVSINPRVVVLFCPRALGLTLSGGWSVDIRNLIRLGKKEPCACAWEHCSGKRSP